MTYFAAAEDLRKKISFFFCDTTLRDGEQVKNVHYTPEQKLKIAEKLDELGVESIDAGFPATSQEERSAIRKICDSGLKMRIMSMCRVNRDEVDLAISCGVGGVILFIPGSDIHLRAKFGDDLGKIRKELISKSHDAIAYAKDMGLVVEYGLEDATRTEFSFLQDALHMGDETGADFLGITDTVGAATPEMTFDFVSRVVREIPKPIGVHCHNDFGLATANTIAGLLAGAGYCSPTVNGMGERAGNASLEEVIMILTTLYGLKLPYRTQKLAELSDLVQQLSGIQMDVFKPVVGNNVFSHESGIHTHGMLKDPGTYEILNPELVGRRRTLAFGKHSGRHLVKYLLEKKGFVATDELVKDFWSKMKEKEEIGIRFTEEAVIDSYQKYRIQKSNQADFIEGSPFRKTIDDITLDNSEK